MGQPLSPMEKYVFSRLFDLCRTTAADNSILNFEDLQSLSSGLGMVVPPNIQLTESLFLDFVRIDLARMKPWDRLSVLYHTLLVLELRGAFTSQSYVLFPE